MDDGGTRVLDVEKARVIGHRRASGEADAELEPERGGVGRDRLARVLGSAEDVDEVDRLVDLSQ